MTHKHYPIVYITKIEPGQNPGEFTVLESYTQCDICKAIIARYWQKESK